MAMVCKFVELTNGEIFMVTNVTNYAHMHGVVSAMRAYGPATIDHNNAAAAAAATVAGWNRAHDMLPAPRVQPAPPSRRNNLPVWCNRNNVRLARYPKLPSDAEVDLAMFTVVRPAPLPHRRR